MLEFSFYLREAIFKLFIAFLVQLCERTIVIRLYSSGSFAAIDESNLTKVITVVQILLAGNFVFS